MEPKCIFNHTLPCSYNIDHFCTFKKHWFGHLVCELDKFAEVVTESERMTNKDLAPVSVDDMIKLMEIFDTRDSPTKDDIYAFGREQGYSDFQIDGMMECLLNYGYIYEPIKDHFKMHKRIGE